VVTHPVDSHRAGSTLLLLTNGRHHRPNGPYCPPRRFVRRPPACQPTILHPREVASDRWDDHLPSPVPSNLKQATSKREAASDWMGTDSIRARLAAHPARDTSRDTTRVRVSCGPQIAPEAGRPWSVSISSSSPWVATRDPLRGPVAIHIRTSQSIKYISIDPSGTGPNLRVSATRCELTMRSTDATPDGGPALDE